MLCYVIYTNANIYKRQKYISYIEMYTSTHDVYTSCVQIMCTQCLQYSVYNIDTNFNTVWSLQHFNFYINVDFDLLV